MDHAHKNWTHEHWSAAGYAATPLLCQHDICLLGTFWVPFEPKTIFCDARLQIPAYGALTTGCQQGYCPQMSSKPPKKTMSEAHNSFHAEKRRKRRGSARGSGAKGSWGDLKIDPDDPSRLFLYGLHTVRHAIENPRRKKLHLYATPNALPRLEMTESQLAELPLSEAFPKELDRMVGSDAVHQGCVLEVEPLTVRPLSEVAASALLLVLDQITDPHNVGAIMRSAVAMNAGALITTARHSPVETGVLAKSASGALDMLDHIAVRNLAGALEELHGLGYQTVGLDSEGPDTLENSISGSKIALVLGSEGKGLRHKTRQTCTTLARVDMPGPIKSLNVSNAAALSLYIAHSRLIA